MRRRTRERQEKREDRPILKRLRAAFLRSFRGLHGEKNGLCEGSARGNLDPTKANGHFNPTQTGLGTASPR